MSIERHYAAAAATPSDINEHLPTLRALAEECQHVTEFGVRWGASTCAFMMSGAKLISYDIDQHPAALRLFEVAAEEGRQAEFLKGNTLTLEKISPTELLFIDTLHTYKQLSYELFQFHKYVKKYIALHDTVIFGEKGEDGGLGLIAAVSEFLTFFPTWKIKSHYENNNGLTVLERA